MKARPQISGAQKRPIAVTGVHPDHKTHRYKEKLAERVGKKRKGQRRDGKKPSGNCFKTRMERR